MTELTFDAVEIQEAVNELVPEFQRKLVFDAVGIETPTESDFDRIGLSLTGEQKKLGFIVATSVPLVSERSMWGAIKVELYDLLCTSSKKYANERREGGLTVKNTITIVATAVASTFHVAFGVIAGAVTVALLSALKIGKNAWCEINKPQSSAVP